MTSQFRFWLSMLTSFVCIFTTLGCVKDISFEEALESDFLSLSPVELEKYASSLEEFSDVELNQLFASAYQQNHSDTCLFLINIGANGEIAVPSNSDIFDEQILYNLIALNSAKAKESEMIKLLIEKDPNILNRLVDADPSRQSYQTTMFHILSEYSSAELIEYALRKGANPNSLNSVGNTPLFDAVKGFGFGFGSSNEKKLIISLLFEYGANADIVNNYGSAIIHYFRWWPVEDDFSELVEKFIDAAGVNMQDSDGDTLAHNIITSGTFLYQNSVPFFQVLLDNGADFSIRNNKGETVRRSFNRATAQYRKMAPEDLTDKLKKDIKRIEEIDRFLTENGFPFLSG